MGKLDQIRALRESRFERRKPVASVNNTQHEGSASVINTNAQRQAKWRKANTELNRQRARDGMRKRRAINNQK